MMFLDGSQLGNSRSERTCSRMAASSRSSSQEGETPFHTPVLAREVIACLAPEPGELFVDGTLGGGGHSEALLREGARVIGLDQDPDAIRFAESRLCAFGDRFRAVRANFADVTSVLAGLGVNSVDGVLLDLGVSSWQLETAARGFSFAKPGPLDMRMDPDAVVSAASLVNDASPEELARIFREYGEEPAARRIAAAIVRERAEKPIATTLDLTAVVEKTVPRRGRTHPATRVFQALRIAVNRELEILPEALEAISALLRPGGRFGVITFHSLEDRMVKSFFKQRSTRLLDRPEWPEPRPNPDFFFEPITRKAVTADRDEQTSNPRSRSAKLRVVRKI